MFQFNFGRERQEFFCKVNLIFTMQILNSKSTTYGSQVLLVKHQIYITWYHIRYYTITR